MAERAHHTAGFTLLEVLVVLVLVSILVGLTVLSLGDRQAQVLDEEARRLAALMDLARQEAILKSRELGVRVEDHGYRFVIWDQGRWQTLGEAELRPRELPPGLRLDLRLDGLPLALDSAEADSAPQIALLSSGETTAFTLRIVREDEGRAYALSGTATGSLSLDGPR